MRSFFNFAKTTVIGGIIFFIPFTIIVYAIKEINNTLYEIVSPLMISLGITSIGGKILVITSIIFLVLLICFIAGLIVKMRFAKKANSYLDSLALKYIPGYSKLRVDVLKKIDETQIKEEPAFYDRWQAVMIKHGAEWRISFIVEESKEGLLTVFEPASAEIQNGIIKIISKDETESLPIE